MNELFGSFSWWQITTVSANKSFIISIYGKRPIWKAQSYFLRDHHVGLQPIFTVNHVIVCDSAIR